MKKKLYQNPEMEVVELNHNQALLAGSDQAQGCTSADNCGPTDGD